jgi:Tol biopolymer transport system component
MTRTALLLVILAIVDQGLDESQSKRATQGSSVHPGVPTADVSADGNLVAFESAVALTDRDRDPYVDVYVLDRRTGSITLETESDEEVGPGTCGSPRLSGDGRYLVFTAIGRSGAADVVAFPQVFLKDRELQRSVMVSRAATGAPGNGVSSAPQISDDGQTVVFESSATDLVPGADPNGTGRDVYVFDVRRRMIDRIASDAAVPSPERSSFAPSVSGDGRIVAFAGSTPLAGAAVKTILAPIARRRLDVYVHDRATTTTTLVSRGADGGVSNGSSFYPTISADGRVVAFASSASNLGPRDRNRADDVYLHDLGTSRTRLAVTGHAGAGADGSSSHPALSGDGRFVVASSASNLACGKRCRPETNDMNLVDDVYRVDTLSGDARRVSGISEQWWESSVGPSIDASGAVVAFSTRHPIGAADVDAKYDLWVAFLSVQ